MVDLRSVRLRSVRHRSKRLRSVRRRSVRLRSVRHRSKRRRSKWLRSVLSIVLVSAALVCTVLASVVLVSAGQCCAKVGCTVLFWSMLCCTGQFRVGQWCAGHAVPVSAVLCFSGQQLKLSHNLLRLVSSLVGCCDVVCLQSLVLLFTTNCWYCVVLGKNHEICSYVRVDGLNKRIKH